MHDSSPISATVPWAPMSVNVELYPKCFHMTRVRHNFHMILHSFRHPMLDLYKKWTDTRQMKSGCKPCSGLDIHSGSSSCSGSLFGSGYLRSGSNSCKGSSLCSDTCLAAGPTFAAGTAFAAGTTFAAGPAFWRVRQKVSSYKTNSEWLAEVSCMLPFDFEAIFSFN